MDMEASFLETKRMGRETDQTPHLQPNMQKGSREPNSLLLDVFMFVLSMPLC
jgi:hypothetical protein